MRRGLFVTGTDTGVGKTIVCSALMQRYIEHLVQAEAAGYLETDRPENVEFYKKFGFAVRHTEELIGTPTWYMWRPAGAPQR